MFIIRQSTAIAVTIGPFVDNTDGFTPEGALVIVQADVRLSKNGGNYAQKNDANACVYNENGWYVCQLDVTDTNTLGRLMLAVFVAGALPAWHEFLVVSANVWDSLFGTDKLQVDTVQLDGEDVGDRIIISVNDLKRIVLG